MRITEQAGQTGRPLGGSDRENTDLEKFTLGPLSPSMKIVCHALWICYNEGTTCFRTLQRTVLVVYIKSNMSNKLLSKKILFFTHQLRVPEVPMGVLVICTRTGDFKRADTR